MSEFQRGKYLLFRFLPSSKRWLEKLKKKEQSERLMRRTSFSVREKIFGNLLRV